jgi:hypothetical protein
MIFDLVLAAVLLGGGLVLVLAGLAGIYIGLGRMASRQSIETNEGDEHGS